MHRAERDAKSNYDDLYDSEFISFDHDGSLYSDDGGLLCNIFMRDPLRVNLQVN